MVRKTEHFPVYTDTGKRGRQKECFYGTLYVNHICVKHIDYFLCVFVVENIISEISSMLNFFMP